MEEGQAEQMCPESELRRYKDSARQAVDFMKRVYGNELIYNPCRDAIHTLAGFESGCNIAKRILLKDD